MCVLGQDLAYARKTGRLGPKVHHPGLVCDRNCAGRPGLPGGSMVIVL
jgi:hypothetical protein